MLLAIGLFALAAAAAATAQPALTRVPVSGIEIGPAPGDEATADRPERRDGADADAEPPELAEPGILPDVGNSELVRFLAGLLFVVLLGVAVAILWRSMRDRITLRPLPEPDTEERKEQVRAAVRASLDELAADGPDPRAAVIGCWLRLEQAAAAAGTRREPADTPGDLVARMLAAHQVSGAVLDRLATAYRRARYAPHEIGEELRDEARAALRQMHAELGRSRSEQVVG